MTDSSALNVAVVGILPFSEAGGGAIARVRNLALALRSAGAKPAIFLVGPKSTQFFWREIPVVVHAQNIEQRTLRSRSFAWPWRTKRVNAEAVKSIANAISRLALNRSLDVVMLYNQDLGFSWPLWSICRGHGIVFIQQYAEIHSAADYATGWRSTYWLRERAHLHVMPRFADGSIVISRLLREKINRSAVRDALLVPTVAEIPRAPYRKIPFAPEILAVSNGTRRDCLGLLLQAMGRLVALGGLSELRIVGLAPDACASLGMLVKEHGLELRVHLEGKIDESLFRERVAQADVHVLLRTKDTSSAACFPSRLFELFSNGAPVVLNEVGDLPYYFRNEIDVLLVPPDNVDALGNRLLWIEQNRDLAAKIGATGSVTAQRAFSPETHGRHILAYMQQIVEAKR